LLEVGDHYLPNCAQFFTLAYFILGTHNGQCAKSHTNKNNQWDISYMLGSVQKRCSGNIYNSNGQKLPLHQDMDPWTMKQSTDKHCGVPLINYKILVN